MKITKSEFKSMIRECLREALDQQNELEEAATGFRLTGPALLSVEDLADAVYRDNDPDAIKKYASDKSIQEVTAEDLAIAAENSDLSREIKYLAAHMKNMGATTIGGMAAKLNTTKAVEALDAATDWDDNEFNKIFEELSNLYEAAEEPATTDIQEADLDEGIFGNKYKGKTILAYRGNGKDEPVAIGDIGDNLIYFKRAHAKKYNYDESDYAPVAATDVAVKRYGKALKSIPDVTDKLPQWVSQYVADAKVQAEKDFKNAELRKKRDAEAAAASRAVNYQRQGQKNPEDDYTYVQGKGTGTYKYREDLDLEESGDDDYVYIQGAGYGTYRPSTREGLEDGVTEDNIF